MSQDSNQLDESKVDVDAEVLAYLARAEKAQEIKKSKEKDDVTEKIAIAKILKVSNPRKYFDPAALEALADSIKEKGLLQPILVRPTEDGYELVAGERRMLAHKHLKLHYITATIRPMTDEEVMLNKTAENWQREDLSAYEKAVNIVEVLEHYFADELNDVRILHGVEGNEALRQLVNNSRRNVELKERWTRLSGKASA